MDNGLATIYSSNEKERLGKLLQSPIIGPEICGMRKWLELPSISNNKCNGILQLASNK